MVLYPDCSSGNPTILLAAPVRVDSLRDGSLCSCVGEESRHLGSAGIAVEALEVREDDKRVVRSRSCHIEVLTGP
jgi:hypothetical protein